MEKLVAPRTQMFNAIEGRKLRMQLDHLQMERRKVAAQMEKQTAKLRRRLGQYRADKAVAREQKQVMRYCVDPNSGRFLWNTDIPSLEKTDLEFMFGAEVNVVKRRGSLDDGVRPRRHSAGSLLGDEKPRKANREWCVTDVNGKLAVPRSATGIPRCKSSGHLQEENTARRADIYQEEDSANAVTNGDTRPANQRCRAARVTSGKASVQSVEGGPRCQSALPASRDQRLCAQRTTRCRSASPQFRPGQFEPQQVGYLARNSWWADSMDKLTRADALDSMVFTPCPEHLSFVKRALSSTPRPVSPAYGRLLTRPESGSETSSSENQDDVVGDSPGGANIRRVSLASDRSERLLVEADVGHVAEWTGVFPLEDAEESVVESSVHGSRSGTDTQYSNNNVKASLPVIVIDAPSPEKQWYY